nr:hypothetical protein [uncultured Cohaesibacter sp.]
MSIFGNAFERLIAAREAEARNYIELYAPASAEIIAARDNNDK